MVWRWRWAARCRGGMEARPAHADAVNACSHLFPLYSSTPHANVQGRAEGVLSESLWFSIPFHTIISSALLHLLFFRKTMASRCLNFYCIKETKMLHLLRFTKATSIQRTSDKDA
jgi:hypothetical protein